jgi:dCMP deaminase
MDYVRQIPTELRNDMHFMKQESKDEIFMEMAHSVAKMSKCVKYKVGCMLVHEGRVISIGYNGTPSGFINCCDKFTENDMHNEILRKSHTEWAENFEVHAEMNAILFAAKHGISTDDCTLYCTMQPCTNCLKHAVQSGIKRIVYSMHRQNYGTDMKILLDMSKIEIKCMLNNRENNVTNTRR